MTLRKIFILSAGSLSLMACSQGTKLSSNAPGAGVGIVNGTTVDFQTNDAAKHVVGLVFFMKPKPDAAPDAPVATEICTGTLITSDIVLTAAHCAKPDFEHGFVVFSTDIRRPQRNQLREISSKSVNSLWDESHINQIDIGDTALVKFDGGLPDGYSPAEILDDPSVLTDGANVIEMGYGVAYPTKPNAQKGVGVLRTTTVAILDSTTARTEILTDESHGSGVCQGDSGGPAFVEVNGKTLLWGVASRVFGPPPPPKPDPNAAPTPEAPQSVAEGSETPSNPPAPDAPPTQAPKPPPPPVLCNRASIETNIVMYKDWLQEEVAKLETDDGQPSLQMVKLAK